MANPQHESKLKEGIDAWNAWRRENQDVTPDLRGASLGGGNAINNANFGGANFEHMDLDKANFRGANLKRAKFDHSSLQGANLQGANLEYVSFIITNLQEADLRGANLYHAKFQDASLRGAILTDMTLLTDFGDTDLTNANLSNANLTNANFRRANLTNTNLTNATLHGARLEDTKLHGAIFSGTRFSSRTVFSELASELSDSEIEGCIFEDEVITAEPEQRDSHLKSQTTFQRVVVKATDVQNDLPKVVTSLKLSVKSALIQIEKYREEVRQNNQLCDEHHEFHEKLLQMLDRIRNDLNEIYEAIPQNVESVSVEEAEKIAGYFERFKNENSVQMEKYLSPEALSRAAFPTAIVLSCSAVGSFFGPIGFAAGGHFGNMLTNNLKPDAVANKLGDKLISDSSDTPDQ